MSYITSDIAVLKVLSKKDNLIRWKKHISSCLGATTRELLNDFEEYFKEFPDESKVNLDTFIPWFREVRHFGDKYEKVQALCSTVESMHKASVVAEDKIIEAYRERTLKESVSVMALDPKYSLNDINEYITKNHVNQTKSYDQLLYTDDIHQTLSSTDKSTGLRWRLKQLNEGLGPLTKGEFGVICARPNAGKTSLIAHELSYMAHQLKEDENILWFNNEGMEAKIKLRIYSSTLGKSYADICKDTDKAEMLFKERKADRILLFDIKGRSYTDIERICNEYKPGVVVIDMMDNVHGFESGNTALERLRDLYQWGLEFSCQHCPVIGTSQLNREAEGECYPPMSVLEGSGTAKQAAASFVLMLGKSHLPEDENVRYLSAPKNKYGAGYFREAVMFDPQRCLFYV